MLIARPGVALGASARPSRGATASSRRLAVRAPASRKPRSSSGPADEDAGGLVDGVRRATAGTPSTPAAPLSGTNGTAAAPPAAAPFPAPPQIPSPEELNQAVAAAADGAARAVDEAAAAVTSIADDAANAARGVTASLAADARAAAGDAIDAAAGLATAAVNATAELSRGLGAAAAPAWPAAAPVNSSSAAPAPSATGGGGSGGSSGGSGSGGGGGGSGRGSSSGGRQRKPASGATIEKLKVRLLAAVASLDRGLAANLREASEVDALAARLEDAGGGDVALSWTTSEARPDESSMELMAGTWRLIYSSGFNTGSLGGRRPGPPAAFVPLVLGQIYQVIDPKAARLDNVVELFAAFGGLNLPFLDALTASRPAPATAPSSSSSSSSSAAPAAAGGSPSPAGAAATSTAAAGAPGAGDATAAASSDPRRRQRRRAAAANSAAPGVRLTLGHSYEVTGPSTVRIVYEDTSARAIGPDFLANLPALAAPSVPDFLKPPRDWRAASFDVTFLDDTMRITRGDRGELRVYLRDEPLEAAPFEDYVD